MKRALIPYGYGEWRTLVPETTFTDCIRQSISILKGIAPAEKLGDYMEFGVSRGTSMACVYKALEDMGIDSVRLLGFDSFDGLPPEADKEGWHRGLYRSTKRATVRYLKRRGVDMKRTILIKGWFKDTLTVDTRREHSIGKASLVLIDCDIYSASRDALFFSQHHIENHAVVILDDWGSALDKGLAGQKEAFSELLSTYDDLAAKPLPTYRPGSRVFLVSRTNLNL